ncbi:glycosyltransferase family 4 protein [Candidatus Woesebacteria bacterium]|nr:glycosyltransferase family 4 protein [Candidatus Woesebacteria bacterium]
MKKKLLFISRLYYPHVGGVEKHIFELKKVLLERDYEISLVAERHDVGVKFFESQYGINVYRISYPKIRFFGLIIIWIKLLRFIPLIRKSDIVHVHDVFLWYLPFRLLFPFKNVYMTFHGYSEFPLRKITILQKKLTNSLVKGWIGVGEFIEKWYGVKLDKITYGAVDIKDFLPKKTKIIYDAVFASRLSDQTGIAEYLESIKILKSKYDTKIRVVVLGDGEYKKDADKLTKTKGFVRDVVPFFNKSKIAFVNRYLAILEAFANKKLVIATYNNEIKKDYLMMTPFKDWIVVEKDPEKLAEKIKYYLDHPEKAKPMIEAAYKWVQGQTWEKMADTYEELWGVKKK